MTLLQHLFSFLHTQPTAQLLIAYSGGVDSHVLLHALKQLQQQLPKLSMRAIHVNHGLNPKAQLWQAHAQQVCGDLDIPLITHNLQLTIPKGESVESIARRARYALCAQVLQDNEILCTAHHQDDQGETVLLQLLRGAGPKGLAAMPKITAFAQGYHARPLLNIARADLLAYASLHRLHWVEDDSNTHTAFDRNFLRHQIMPLLTQRFPAAAKTLSRSASHCASAQQLLEEYLSAELIGLQGSMRRTLSRSKLAQLSTSKQRYLLRSFMLQREIPMPSTAQLSQIVALLSARPDAQSLVTWQNYSARFYRDDLFIELNDFFAPIADIALTWDGTGVLSLPQGSICLIPASPGPLSQQILHHPITVRFRAHSGPSIKKALQNANIAPWQRWQLPLIYAEDTLAAIGDCCVMPAFRAASNEAGLQVVWSIH